MVIEAMTVVLVAKIDFGRKGVGTIITATYLTIVGTI